MKEYVIVSDSTCDLTAEVAESLGVIILPLTFTIDGKDYLNYLDGREMNLPQFYDRMLEGAVPKTAQLNVRFIEENLKPIIASGRDVLYISFSSGLSGSCNAAHLARTELLEDYPDAHIEIVDSLCASAGEGVLVYMTAKNKEKGATLEANTKYANDLRLHIKHSFTVLDVEYLKRGGRLKPSAAFAAKVLNIKPVLFVNNEGKLIALAKKHGRRAALVACLENALDGIETKNEFITIISGANCDEDREFCKNYLEKKYEELHIPSSILLTNIGPVIGSHSGPGTLAIFTVGDKRE